MNLASKIRSVPDFPVKGILFYDITTLLEDATAFKESVDQLAARYQDTAIDLIVGVESRGFIFGAALAYKLNTGFVPVRKPGKLPAKTLAESYELEYGTNMLEIHEDAINPGQKVLVVDDLLATGGTAKAACTLIERLGGEVASIAFIIELTFLNGRASIEDYDIFSILKYDE
jgi:adenine phosphoribosyltransferase